ncbi:MAG: rod shape-determining protein MreD [Sphingomonas sp.]|nr:rod shape-determining protein MreD [Sphingomonas sp.]
MVRSALSSKRRIGESPPGYAPFIPALSVVAASLLSALPIISVSGWYPDFAFLMLIAWRLLRSDLFPAWWAAPLGLVNDLFTGAPTGFSVALWCAAVLVLDLADRRTMWRDYWIEWVLAAVLIVVGQWFEWRVAAWGGADVPLVNMVPSLAISILLFPVVAWLVLRIDRWRLAQ